MIRKSLATAVFITALVVSPNVGLAIDETHAASVETMLMDFVIDYRSDPSASKATCFGISVADHGEWKVKVKPREGPGTGAAVELSGGLPSEPSFFFVTDRETLAAIHSGQMNALTAMGRARMSDPTPLDIKMMDGFVPEADFFSDLLPLIFHFWTRGLPEIIPFGETSMTRHVHGGNALVFYYQPGFRSAWFQIHQGQHVNADKEDQVNPFPTLLIVTAGRLDSRIDGRESSLEKGQAVLIPAGTPHEFWQTRAEPAEGILLMFGEGA